MVGVWNKAGADRAREGLVAWPYAGGSLAGGLSPAGQRRAMKATLLAPVPVLGGTFAGADVLRSARLYREFPLGQSVPFSYASPREALSGAAEESEA